MSKKSQSPRADLGDYMKLCACTAVMLQTILGLALTTHPSSGVQTGIGIVYNFVKFTAPAFIFGILYTTTRTTIDTDLTYPNYMKKQWHALFVPTIWWTAVYLFLMPWVQQVNQYHDIGSFLWHFVNGNAAPHLWYNTMMLQFIILMPLFWLIGRWCGANIRHGIIAACGAILVTALWLWFYDVNIFHGPHMTDWYLFDRFFLSFFIYGVFGVLAWQYRHFFNAIIQKWWWLIAIVFVGTFVWTNRELLAFGLPVSLGNAPYYKPSMTVYDLSIIGLIAALGLFQLRHKMHFTYTVHTFANFAYKAYLSNVFWAQILWHIGGQQLMSAHPVIGIVGIYLCTWVLAFASAFGLHWFWQNIQVRVLKRAVV
jgi:hypothetical protein